MSGDELHVYSMDGCYLECVIARSEEDALQMEMQWTGMSRDDLCEASEGENPYKQIPDEATLSIEEEDCDPQDPLPEGGIITWGRSGARIVTATCRAWADLCGRTWLCSSEY